MKKIVAAVVVLCLFASFSPKEITWVAIGDSITYLNDHPNETGNRVQKGYLSAVVDKLPNIHYVNQGHNGWTSVKIAAEIEKLGLVKADIFSVFLGTNDWWSGQPLGTLQDYQNQTGYKTVFGSYRIIVDKIRSLNNAAKIILITPMQRGDFVYFDNYKNNAHGSYKEKNGQALEQFANAVISIATYENFAVVDLYHKKQLSVKHLVKYKYLKDPQTGVYKNFTYPAYTKIPFNADSDKYPYPPAAIDITYDGLHPSDKGNAIIASMLVAIMKNYN
ncbi:MAG: SGNH/GDSL hydrolase family protein [Bacteroidota bacterium]